MRAAATRLIAAQGFAAVSMREIAAEVGLQAGALYSYTPNKEAMLLDLVTAHLDALIAGWAAHPSRTDPDPVAAVEAFAKYHLGCLLEAPDASRILRLELRNLSNANRTVVAEKRARYDSALVALLEKGSAAKLFAVPDADLAARAVFALLDGVADWAADSGMAPDRVARISWNMVRRAIGAKGFQ